MLNLKKYLLYSFKLILLFFFVIIENTDAQEVQLKEGDKITIELFNSRKLNGKFVRMDSVSITYIPSGKTPFYNPKENIVKLEKIKQIYNEKGFFIYVTPKNLRDYDYPTHEAFIGYSLIIFNKHTHTSGDSYKSMKGISLAGGGTINKWLNLELKLNAYKKEGGYLQLFLSATGYHKKHRFFAGVGAGVFGLWLILTEPVYSVGGGAKLYLFKDIAVRLGAYDYMMPSFKRREHNFIIDIGVTIAEW